MVSVPAASRKKHRAQRSCLTLRESTERPVTITEGTNEIVGTNPGDIDAAIQKLRADRRASKRPALWDGKAAVRIVDILERDVLAMRKNEPGSEDG